MDYLEIRELYHHGIKGQRWGIRRFQNKDGSFTEEGKKRYGVNSKGVMSEEGEKLYDKDRKKSKRNKVLIATAAAAAGAAITIGILKAKGKMKFKELHNAEKEAMRNYNQAWSDRDKAFAAWEKQNLTWKNFFKNDQWKRHAEQVQPAEDKLKAARAAYNKASDATNNHLLSQKVNNVIYPVLGLIGSVSVGSITASKESHSIKKDKEKYRSDTLRNLSK